MANLDLDIVKKRDTGSDEWKTHTTFRMKWYEKVVFHNFEKEDLVVTIQAEQSFDSPVLCDASGSGVEKPITVGPRGSKEFAIFKGYEGTFFKYTAQIGGADKEDPIVIIER